MTLWGEIKELYVQHKSFLTVASHAALAQPRRPKANLGRPWPPRPPDSSAYELRAQNPSERQSSRSKVKIE